MAIKIKEKDRPIAAMLSDMLRKRGLPAGARQRVLSLTLDQIRLEELKMEIGKDDPRRLTAVVSADRLVLLLPERYTETQRLEIIGRWMKIHRHANWKLESSTVAADGRTEELILPVAKTKPPPASKAKKLSRKEEEALEYLRELMPDLNLGGLA